MADTPSARDDDTPNPKEPDDALVATIFSHSDPELLVLMCIDAVVEQVRQSLEDPAQEIEALGILRPCCVPSLMNARRPSLQRRVKVPSTAWDRLFSVYGELEERLLVELCSQMGADITLQVAMNCDQVSFCLQATQRSRFQSFAPATAACSSSGSGWLVHVAG